MRLRAVVIGVLGIAASAAAQTVSVHIEPSPGGRSEFQVGELIGLTLTFELHDVPQAPDPNRPGWTISLNAYDRNVLGIGHDRFVVSPEAGTRDPWNYRLHELIVYNGPAPGTHLGDKPLILNYDLNQWVRFERPGHYTVYLIAHATGPQAQNVELVSNQIGVDIIAADPEWQAAELASDIAVLDATYSPYDGKSIEAHMNAARRIAYLDTPAAVREMARRVGTADYQTASILSDGLRSSQYGSLAIVTMRELLRAPSQPVPFIFLGTLAGLDKTVKDSYALLAGVIGLKVGSAKALSIKTLLDRLSAETISPELRSEIIALFPDLPDSQQFDLLGQGWKKIDGLEMVPVLRHIYDTMPKTRQPENIQLRLVIQRLYELDTNGTRSLLIEEMKRRDLRLPYSTLSMLFDPTLPELDAMLLDNFQHGVPYVAELIARYATDSILGPIKEHYMKWDAETRSLSQGRPICEPPLVAYFLRADPAWGENLFRALLAQPGDWCGIIGLTAPYYSGPVWEKIAIDALQDPAVPVKIDAVRSLGQYGSPESKSAVFDAFRDWHQWWETRGEPNDENRRLEEAFVEATTRSKNWAPSANDLATVRDLCMTAGCRSQVPRPFN